MAGVRNVMRTIDGYIIKTKDSKPVICKNPDDYDYPLTSKISTGTSYTSVISTVTSYTSVVDP